MKRFEGQKAYIILNGIFHIVFMLILSFFIFSLPGYGSTDIPVKVNATPAALGADALFGILGNGTGMTNQGIYTVLNGNIGTTAASPLVTGFDDEGAVYTETISNIGTLNGTKHKAHPLCQDSCSL